MKFFMILLVLVSVTATAFAYDPSPLQDYCVGTNRTRDGTYVNGKFCKHPNLVVAEDFLYKGFRNRGNTSNRLGSSITGAFVDNFLGLNTLGVSMDRADFAPGGLVLPHIHPLASQIMVVVRGTLYAGFISSDRHKKNFLFATVLRRGDLFVFPKGQIHFQLNVGRTRSLAYSSFNSQNPGLITIPDAVFGSRPLISIEVLAKAFRLKKEVIEYLQSQTWSYNETECMTHKDNA